MEKLSCRESAPVPALAVKVSWLLCSDLFRLFDPIQVSALYSMSPRPSAFLQRLCIPGFSLRRQALVLWLCGVDSQFSVALYFSLGTRSSCV